MLRLEKISLFEIHRIFLICIFLLFTSSELLAEKWDVVVGDESSYIANQQQPTTYNHKDSFNPEPLKIAERMTTREILNKEIDSRCKWYKEKIGTFISNINTFALDEGVPPKLLVTIVLNELADIDMTDVIQDQQLAGTKGDYNEYQSSLRVALWWKSIAKQSFGISQISPKTALKYNAVHIPPSLKSRMIRENEVELFVAYRLLDRRTAISAAAKIIKGIMLEIEEHQEVSLWARQFIRPSTRFSVDNPYVALFPSPLRNGTITPFIKQEREKKLAQMVTAIYNSDGILTASKVPNAGDDKTLYFPNALKHSQNAYGIAEDFFETKVCDIKLQSLPSTVNNPNDNDIVAWINLFGENDKSGRVHVGTLALFKNPRRYRDELFAGLGTTHLNKKRIFANMTFDSTTAARKFLCQQIGNKHNRVIPGHGTYPKGDIDGGTYWINGLGCKIPAN